MANNEYINKLIADLNAKMQAKGETVIKTDDTIHTYINEDFVQFSCAENILNNDEIKECFKNTNYSYFKTFTDENNFVHKQGTVTDEFIAAMEDKGFEHVAFTDSENTIDFVKDGELYRLDRNLDSSIFDEMAAVEEQKTLNLAEYLERQHYTVAADGDHLDVTKIIEEKNEVDGVKNTKTITFQVDKSVLVNEDIQEYFATRQTKNIDDFKAFMGAKGYEIQEDKGQLCVQNPAQDIKLQVNKKVLTDENIDNFFRLKTVTNNAEAVTFALENKGQNHTQHHEVNYNYIGQQRNEKGLRTGYSISEYDLKNLLYNNRNKTAYSGQQYSGQHNGAARLSQGINRLTAEIKGTLQAQLTKGLYKSEEGRAVAETANDAKQIIRDVKNRDIKGIASNIKGKIVGNSEEVQSLQRNIGTMRKSATVTKQSSLAAVQSVKAVINTAKTAALGTQAVVQVGAGVVMTAVALINPAALAGAVKCFAAAGKSAAQAVKSGAVAVKDTGSAAVHAAKATKAGNEAAKEMEM